MKKRILLLSLNLLVILAVKAQLGLTIPQIQGGGSHSPYSGKIVKTTGVVTAKFIGGNKVNGFFMQDATGDGNPNTSDGIFVYYTKDDINIGDEIIVTGKVEEKYDRTQISSVSEIKITNNNYSIAPTKITYDIYNWNWEKYEGMLIEFDQTLWVNDNSHLQKYGQLELGIKRKKSPTDVTLPGSTAYQALVSENNLSPITLDDGYMVSGISPIIFADENGTRRTGERIDKLRAVVDYAYGIYRVYPVQLPLNFYGNPRPTEPKDLGNHNLKVCAFNLEYYLTQNFGSGYGPDNETQSNRQHIKIIEALKAIDADIYGLVEIEQGQEALYKLAQGLSAATGNPYDFINDGGKVYRSYTKCAYLYRTDKVTPYKSIKKNNSPGPYNRKMLQAFTLNANGEKFMYSVNHFKSKSGCSSASGENSDQHDGQSCYNAKRLAEATSTVNFINVNKAYYADEDALIMGDLNAYTMEDPIRYFTENGYTNLLAKYEADTSYSYVYKGETGYLDHALANLSMTKQVTGATVFHINSDEPEMFGYSASLYQPNMYRSSDHDPVVVGLRLGKDTQDNISFFEEKIKIFPTYTKDMLTIEKAENCYVQLFNLNGIKLLENKINAKTYTLSLSSYHISSGIYILRILGENKIIQKKIVVK